MEDEFDIREARVPESEREYENALRPLSFHDFSGQAKVVENLKIFVMAARMRKEALDHVLLHGPPGLGSSIDLVTSVAASYNSFRRTISFCASAAPSVIALLS